jgi:hypothetical protein
MANLVPLNTFKTLTAVVTTTPQAVYTTPAGVSTVVLLAQFVNVSSNTGNVTMYQSRSGTDIEIAKEFPIPANDAGSLLTGRLILESADSLKVKSGSNNTFKFVFSYLETANA